MVIARTPGETDLKAFVPLLARTRADLMGTPRASQGLGIAWNLVISFAGWVLQGIGLGLSTYDAVKGAKDNVAPDTEMDAADIRAIAQQVATADPQHRSVTQWEAILGGVLQPAPVVTPPVTATCPPGFYRDPTTGACIQPQSAGFQMPTWGWIALGVGGYMVLKQTGILKL